MIDTLYTLEAGPEGEFCKLLSESHVIPLGDKDKGLYCTRGLPFKSNGLPRSDYPDCYCPVCAPKPDYAYGYNDRALDSRQQAKAQSPIYEPYTELYWPFLITEAKSQAMGKTCFQAANQCASGGTVAVNAIATLLDKAYSSPVEPEDGPLVHESERSTISQSTPGARQDNLQNPTDAIVFSVAIDSMAAELYVHWRSADKRTFHLQRIDVYLILRPNELIQLQDKLQRIIAWGMGPRLDAIRTALNILVKNPA